LIRDLRGTRLRQTINASNLHFINREAGTLLVLFFNPLAMFTQGFALVPYRFPVVTKSLGWNIEQTDSEAAKGVVPTLRQKMINLASFDPRVRHTHPQLG
jgi:hypothetical protein